MKTEKLKEKIVTIVKASDGMDKKTISESTSTKGILLEGTLSKLIKENILEVKEKEGQKFYYVSSENSETIIVEEEKGTEINEPSTDSPKKENKKGKKGKASTKSVAEEEEKGEKEKTVSSKGKTEGGRDMRKFRFDGGQHTKGGLVLAVLRKYVEKHKNISVAKLKETFPDELLQRFGVFQEVRKGKNLYFRWTGSFFLEG